MYCDVLPGRIACSLHLDGDVSEGQWKGQIALDGSQQLTLIVREQSVQNPCRLIGSAIANQFL